MWEDNILLDNSRTWADGLRYQPDDRDGVADFGNGPGGSSPERLAESFPSGNPAAINIVTGSGWVGDLIGINRNGWRLAGLNISDANGQFTGGNAPGEWTGDSLTIADLSINLEEFLGWRGAMIGTQFLYDRGGKVNINAGSLMGYNSLDAIDPPRSRAELYQLWLRQELFDKKVVILLGKSAPTYDFNNVVRAVPFSEDAFNIPSVTSALLTSAYVSPTQLGIMPGYYNSATGLVASWLPNDSCYAQYGLFDGNLATGRQTGLRGPTFNGYALHLFEAGTNWTHGSQNKPGKFGIGYWKQTGKLSAPGGMVDGAEGMFLFASQRLYYEQSGQSNDGLSVWGQFAATNSDFVLTHRYFGCGLTYFGPLPCRDNDSAGYAYAYGKMNSNPDAGLGPREQIHACYYQFQMTPNTYLQPNLSYIVTPAARPGLDDVFALTLRAILLF